MASPGQNVERSWDEVWREVLDRLESDLGKAERLASEPETADGFMESHVPWTPPSIPVAMPAAMHDRARDLLARQYAVMDALGAKAHALRQQEKLVSGGSFEKPGPRPAYLDISA